MLFLALTVVCIFFRFGEGSVQYQGQFFVVSSFPAYGGGVASSTEHLIITSLENCTCDITESDGNLTRLQIFGNIVNEYNQYQPRVIPLGVLIEKRAIEIYCTAKVTVYFHQYNLHYGIPAMFSVLPLTSLDTKYHVASAPDFAQVGVVAVFDQTDVIMKLNTSCDVIYGGHTYKSGDNVRVSLNKRDVFQVALQLFECDFEGTTITSSRKIAVFSGATSMAYPEHNMNHVMTQIPPVSTWGQTYVVPGLRDGTPSYKLRIVAKVDATSITIVKDGAKYAESMNEMLLSGFYEENIQSDTTTYIHGTKPVMVTLLGAKDHSQSLFFTVVPSMDDSHTNNDITFILPSTVIRSEGPKEVSVVTTTKCIQNVTNLHAGLSKWNDLPNTGFSVAYYASSHVPRVMSSPCPLAVRIHSFGLDEGYGFYLGDLSIISEAMKGNVLKQSINLTCGLDHWTAVIDTKLLTSAFPSSNINNIYISHTSCRGKVLGSRLMFSSSYNDCNTNVSETSTSFTFNNYLIEYQIYPESNVTTKVLWQYDLECDLPKHDNNSIVVKETTNVKGHDAVIELYSDGSYTRRLTGNPLKIEVGSRVYVQVESHINANVKVMVDSCNVRGSNSTKSLIINRCPAEPSVHMIGHVDKTTRFYFTLSDMGGHNGNISVTCDVSACSLFDFSKECQTDCMASR